MIEFSQSCDLNWKDYLSLANQRLSQIVGKWLSFVNNKLLINAFTKAVF